MSAEEEFLRQIRENPADDTVRLVYADWLDEDGQPERAEFIRVQIELARRYPAHPVGSYDDPAFWNLRDRERELLSASESLWRGPLLDGTELMGHWLAGRHQRQPIQLTDAEGREVYRINCEFSRGFVSHVTLTAAAFLGGECVRCVADTEQMDGSIRREPIQFVPACPACNGTGRTEGLAKELFRHHPIEKVTLSDMIPWVYDIGDGVPVEWGWWEVNPNHPPDPTDGNGEIPPELFQIMWDNSPSNTNQHDDNQRRWLLWDEQGIAEDELSTACVTYGKSRAKEAK